MIVPINPSGVIENAVPEPAHLTCGGGIATRFRKPGRENAAKEAADPRNDEEGEAKRCGNCTEDCEIRFG